MDTVTTELDHRFSDPAATATSWDEARRVLESAELAWIATVRADGRPHVTPLVAVWLHGAFHFATGADEQKGRNLQQNPNVVLTTGCDTWDRGLDLVVEGRAEQVTDDETLQQLATAWTAKWDGRWQFTARDGAFQHEGGEGAALVFAVRPSKVLAFGKEPFSQTRHRP
jgi:nitroimidazol reductase NimA-like FMN-containing flavoprotein (pyridoxamine 5'-phosphate oxidase superfamily)